MSVGVQFRRPQRKRATPCGAALPIRERFKTSANLVRSLLELDGSAGVFDLLLELLGLVLGHAFLDGLRSAFDERLGFAEAKTGDRTDFLDHVDLLATVAGEDDV